MPGASVIDACVVAGLCPATTGQSPVTTQPSVVRAIVRKVDSAVGRALLFRGYR
jgi:uncharacterized protein (DUF362 family)